MCARAVLVLLLQYDFAKEVEHGIKSVAMVAGNAAQQVTIQKPSKYRDRFKLAMDRYFIRIPDQFTFS